MTPAAALLKSCTQPPLKNLTTTSVAKFFANPIGINEHTNKKYVPRNTGLIPKSSITGNKTRKCESEMPNSLLMGLWATDMMVPFMEEMKLARKARVITSHFLRRDQLNGSWGPNSPFQVTIVGSGLGDCIGSAITVS